MNCEWQEGDHAITAFKNIQYANIHSHHDCAVQCISTRYATHAFYMTKTELDLEGLEMNMNHQRCLCMFEHGNLTMQDPNLQNVMEFGSKADLRSCIQDFMPYTLDLPIRDCFEKGTVSSSCCADKGCEIYDGPCVEHSDCKSGACGLKGFCPQLLYPWENLHPHLEEIRCCSERYTSVDTPSKFSQNQIIDFFSSQH